MKTRSLIAIVALVALGGGAYAARDQIAGLTHGAGVKDAAPLETASIQKPQQGVAVTVAPAAVEDFVETVLVTGTLVAREEILVGPEVEGLRVTEVLADEGDKVTKGQVLARLVSDTLEAQLAANAAALARSVAAIAQANSNIVSADARLTEARNAYERGRPLTKSGVLSESLMDQRESAAKTAEAAVAAARDALKVAEADKAQVEAQRRELVWKRSRTDIMAPANGIVSRRVARVGAFAAGAGEAMFRIVANGEIELDAEVPETVLAKMRPGQPAEVAVAGAGDVKGKVRLVSQEIDRTTRLGRVRVLLGEDAGLKVGAFGRGKIETNRARGIGLPVSAVLFGGETTVVQIVRENRVVSTRVEAGINAGGRIEIRKGVSEGDLVVLKSGTFLRDGDLIRPVRENVLKAESK